MIWVGLMKILCLLCCLWNGSGLLIRCVLMCLMYVMWLGSCKVGMWVVVCWLFEIE